MSTLFPYSKLFYVGCSGKYKVSANLLLFKGRTLQFPNTNDLYFLLYYVEIIFLLALSYKHTCKFPYPTIQILSKACPFLTIVYPNLNISCFILEIKGVNDILVCALKKGMRLITWIFF